MIRAACAIVRTMSRGRFSPVSITVAWATLLLCGCTVDFGKGTPTRDGSVGTDGGDSCGNDLLETGEDCDGLDLGGFDCPALGYHSGTLFCADDCTFDVTSCRHEGCGNGQLDPGETCDGSEMGGNTCASQGYPGGTISCTFGCQLDLSQCFWCGNGNVDPSEQCDGENLDQTTCADLGYTGDGLVCDACQFDFSACQWCGNGRMDIGEQCDGNDLGVESCLSQGFTAGGTLACDSNCRLDLAGCIPCDSTTCPDGCCDNGRDCRPGTTTSYCGSNGAACVSCAASVQCCANPHGGGCGACR